MTPALRYPDGGFYVKMGCNTATDSRPDSLAEVQQWFRRGESDACKPAMVRALRSLLPAVEFQGMESKRCIVCYTPDGLPTVDWVSERIAVAAGGNGSGAMVADAVGELAAHLLLDQPWPKRLPRDPFRLRPPA